MLLFIDDLLNHKQISFKKEIGVLIKKKILLWNLVEIQFYFYCILKSVINGKINKLEIQIIEILYKHEYKQKRSTPFDPESFFGI